MTAKQLLYRALLIVSLLHKSAVTAAEFPPIADLHSFPCSEIGEKAGAGYQGTGLAVFPARDGARLHCVFQRLNGEATPEGLWLTSTTDLATDRFRVTATGIGRVDNPQPAALGASTITTTAFPLLRNGGLPSQGEVFLHGQTVRFTRPGLLEEYSVSMDGVRQDFVVLEKPAVAPNRPSELRLELSVAGAVVEPAAYGAQLVLAQSGRKIAYSRLKVSDASGRELSARMEVKEQSGLDILVDDSAAVYPIRIDPTFSDANWVSLGGIRGVNNQVTAATADANGNLYIGGDFTLAGEATASRVAKWNGTSWSALGGGVSGTVYSLATSGNDVYVGGIFQTVTNTGGAVVAARYVAKWDGTNWSTLGVGMSSYVYSISVSGSDVYVGGAFIRATNSGGASIPASRIARWNGSSWSAVGAGVNSDVWALAVAGNDVYAGGNFTIATNSGGGAVTVNRIARWNGTNWSALGGGVNSLVYSLAISGSEVYAAGGFTTATNSGGVSLPVYYIARWNGANWSALGGGMNATVNEITLAGNNLYAVGYFVRATNSGGAAVFVNRAAKWDGNSWSALGSGLDSVLDAVATVGNDVFVGGNFTTVGGVAALRIARWNGSDWSAVGAGLNNSVSALAVSGSDLYAGGQFTTAGTTNAFRIARWNGSEWSPVGGGLDNSVNALAVVGSHLYAAGNFIIATNPGGGAVFVHRIARWDGANWSTVGGGMNNYASVLAVSGNDLYAGGQFITVTNSGGVPVTVNRIARWDGTNWSAIGGGVDSMVSAIAASAGNVFVGGSFFTATNSGGDAVATRFIARWDGINWSALGGGLNSSVNTLVAAETNVFAGGNFTVATNSGGGSVTVNRIARWDGSNWNVLGRGMNSVVDAIAISGADVYAGGSFTRATNSSGPGILVNYFARWDGTNWNASGSGMDNSVFRLLAAGDDLFAAGAFLSAGGKVSAYVAKATANPTPPGYNRITPQLLSDGQMRISYVGLVGNLYALDRTFNLTPPAAWIPQATNVAAADGLAVFTNAPLASTNNFWRVRAVP